MSRSWRAIATVAGNPALARVLAAGGLFVLAEFATWIVVLVYAYEQGGPGTAAALAVIQLVPGVLMGPLTATVTERRSPIALLTMGYATQAATMAATAAVLAAGGPAMAVYVGAVLTATAVTMTRPASVAALPALAGEEIALTAANVVAGWLEDAGTVGAGLMVALLLSLGSPALVFAVAAVMIGCCALLVAHVQVPPVRIAGETGGGCWASLAHGLMTLAARPTARLLVGLIAAMEFVIGALDILLVILAVSVLNQGSQWTGYLNAACGMGGLLAAVITVRLPGRRLGPAVALAAGAAFAGIACTAFSTRAGITLGLLLVAGTGISVFRTAARTLLQRSVPAAQLGTIFGVVEGISMAVLALGAGLVPLLSDLLGPVSTVLAIAAVLPLAAILGHRSLRRLDAGARVPVTEIFVLRTVPILREIPTRALETLAAGAMRRELPDGAVLAHRGSTPDAVRLVIEGGVHRTDAHDPGAAPPGAGPLAVRSRDRRVHLVGEVAVLDQAVHPVTVTARGPVVVLDIPAGAFRAAVLDLPIG